MKDHIEHEKKIIDYTVICRRRKTIGISISPEQGVRVLVPSWVSKQLIQDVVKKKAPWIIKKLIQIEEIKSLKLSKKFIDGETFSFLGKDYKLEVLRQPGIKSTNLAFNNVKFIAGIPGEFTYEEQAKSIRESILEWYMERAAETITDRVEIYSHKLGAKPARVHIKNQKSRWGSCTKDNKININWKIIMAPMEIVDYLVVHELAHIKIKNHSTLYWKLVESVLPDHAKRRKWLRENSHHLSW